MEEEFKRLLNYRNNSSNLPSGTTSIVEHLSTLKELSSICNFVAEVGVEEIVSTFALAQGQIENNSIKKKLWGYDIVDRSKHLRWLKLKELCDNEGISLDFKLGDSIKAELPKDNLDMLFLDGWHVYGQVIRELEYFSPKVDKIICFHDTTVDAEYGETIRAGWDAEEQSKISGIPVNEINKGIWPAITDFLENNKDWILYKRYHNNNGFTILVKNDKDIIDSLSKLSL